MREAELATKASVLERLKREVSIKTAQIGDLEENLQHTKSQLVTKSLLGTVRQS